MRLIRAGGLTVMALLLLPASAIRHELQLGKATAGEQTETLTGTPVSFRQAVKELSFGQGGESFGFVFLWLYPNDLPVQPYTIVRHFDRFKALPRSGPETIAWRMPITSPFSSIP